MKKELVSIVTPVYNGEKYISRLLDSVLEQGYPYIEMIVSDDGSIDGTVNVAHSYIPKFSEKGYSLKVISSPHKNASAAINSALRHISGEYLIWPDADDELMPDSIGKRVEFLKENPSYNAVRSLMKYADDKTGNELALQENLGDLSNQNLFWDILEAKTFVCAGCYMLKTEEFFKIYPNRKIPEYEVGQNFQMLLPFMYKNKCATIKEPLYRVYVRDDGHSRQKRTATEEQKRTEDFEALADDIFRICGLYDNKAALLRLAAWKSGRRAFLARKYGNTKDFIKYKALSAVSKLKYHLSADKRSIQN